MLMITVSVVITEEPGVRGVTEHATERKEFATKSRPLCWIVDMHTPK